MEDDAVNRRKSITIFRRPNQKEHDQPTGRRSISYNVHPGVDSLTGGAYGGLSAENNYGISVERKNTLGKKISKFFKGKEHKPIPIPLNVQQRLTAQEGGGGGGGGGVGGGGAQNDPGTTSPQLGGVASPAGTDAHKPFGPSSAIHDSSFSAGDLHTTSAELLDGPKSFAFPDRNRHSHAQRAPSIRTSDPSGNTGDGTSTSQKNISRENSSGSSIFKPFNPSASSGYLSDTNDSQDGSAVHKKYTSPLPILPQDSDDEVTMNAD